MIYVIGDIHGHYCTLLKLLRDYELINDKQRWIAGSATLCFVGDYVDRGSAGIESIDLIMDLQQQAEDENGQVIALLGNHDISLLGAKHFPDEARKLVKRSFLDDWKRYGGQMKDLENLTDAHIHWLTHLPAMVQLEYMTVVHADSMLYTRYGASMQAVNATMTEILRGTDLDRWDRLIEDFGEKFAFGKAGLFGKCDNMKNVDAFLTHFGGTQIIHGHTPVYRMTNKAATSITEPLIYADGKVVNVDACLYNNGPGFIYEPVRVMYV